MNVNSEIDQLLQYDLTNYGPDFLQTWDHDLESIEVTLRLAKLLRRFHKRGDGFKVFNDGLAVSIFRDKSTRTRFSYASAADAVGLSVADLDEEKSQVSHGETVRETANMISFMTRVIGIRDDMYLGEGQRYMREVAEAVTMGFEEGVLHQRPGLINLQCDIDHPTQSMSDLATLDQFFGGLENLKGKKIVMSWAYSPSYGKPLSVPQGIIGLLTRFGADMVLAHPEGYHLLPDIVQQAEQQATASGGTFTQTDDMSAAFQDAHVVYPKSWAPFNIMEQRTQLLKAGDGQGLKALEAQCLTNNARFQDWECDEGRMQLTHNGEGLYMHCLPADISGVSCAAGEVSAGVFEKYRRQTYLEASYKPFMIAAMMMLTTGMVPKLESLFSQ